LKEELQKTAEQGKEILNRKLKNWKLEFNDQNVKKLLKYFKLKTVTDLYAAIAEEKFDVAELKELLQEKAETSKGPEKIEEDIVEKIVKPYTPKSDDFLIIGENIDNISNLKDKEGSVYHMLGDKICSFLV